MHPCEHPGTQGGQVATLRALWLKLAAAVVGALAVALFVASPAHAADYTVSDEASCDTFLAAIGATGDATPSECTVTSGTLPAGDSLTVANGYGLHPSGGSSASPAFINQGTIYIDGGGGCCNGFYLADHFKNEGTIQFNEVSQNYVTILNSGTLVINAELVNYGRLANGGTLRITCGGRLDSSSGDVTGNAVQVDPGCDLAGPVAAPSQSPAANANGWNSTDVVSMIWDWSDAGVGVDHANCTEGSLVIGEGIFNLTAACADWAGNAGSAAYTVRIDKTPPTLGACPAGGPFKRGSGSQTVGPVAVNAGVSGLNAGASSLSVPVDTASAGLKSVTFTATDNAGNAATLTCTYAVYDPAVVTGAGWFDSPAGAVAAHPTRTDKAVFAFIATYLRGKSVPSGGVEFTLPAANLRFSSTSLDWLVVAGNKALLQGAGRLNGAGGYAFLLAALDGRPDKLRLKIWNRNNGNALVYDNQVACSSQDAAADPCTALRGGLLAVLRTRAGEGTEDEAALAAELARLFAEAENAPAVELLNPVYLPFITQQ